MADYDKLVDDYFDQYFTFHPTEGTAAGFHQYDLMLEDYSQKSRDAEIVFLGEQKQKFATFAYRSVWTEDQRADLKLVSNAIDARLLELQEIRSWQRNPDNYSSSPDLQHLHPDEPQLRASGERLKAVIAREQKMPANFAAARTNLKDVPKIYTEIALQQMPGIISFFQNDVPAAFKSVTEPKLLAEFKASNDKVILELQRYQDFLKNDLLPISNGDFRLGAEKYRKKLQYEEMVDIPLDRLLQIGYDDLHKNQAELKRVAAQIDPEQDAGADSRATGAGPSPARSVAAKFSRHLQRTGRVHPAEADHYAAIAGSAHRGRDAALRARSQLRLDGHSRALRGQGHRSLFQRDLARS